MSGQEIFGKNKGDEAYKEPSSEGNCEGYLDFKGAQGLPGKY